MSGRADRRADRLLDEAEDALAQGDTDHALDLVGQVLEDLPDHPGANFLLGETLRELGALDEAEAAYSAAAHANPEHGPTWSAMGSVQFDQLLFAEANTSFRRALRLDSHLGEAWVGLAMLREREGDKDGARRHYLRAEAIDPEHCRAPVPLDDAMVEAIVEETVRTLDSSVQTWLQGVSIVLEDVPDVEVCQGFDPPAPPGELLGLFVGPSRVDSSVELDAFRGTDGGWNLLPPTIHIFRTNLERLAWDRDHLIEQLRITVFHEIGHFLGLDEHDLALRGLD